MAKGPRHIILNKTLDGGAGCGMGLGCDTMLKPVPSSNRPGVATVKADLAHADWARLGGHGRWHGIEAKRSKAGALTIRELVR